MESRPVRDASLEAARRKEGARGYPLRLADGDEWLFAVPRHRSGSPEAVSPAIGAVIDRIFADSILHESIQADDVRTAAVTLLLENYELSDAELTSLLRFRSEGDWQRLCHHVVGLLFGSVDRDRSFTDWVRYSLLANGLGSVELDTRDVLGVLSILVATNRTPPLTQFVDACREAEEQRGLDQLI